MSIEAVTWALNDAPEVPPSCLAVLIGLANHAHANGRGAYPSQERLAHYARKSTRAVRDDLKTLEALGLIRRGDQRHVAFMPTDRRPVVWDLALERRRELPPSLDVNAEPQSGRPAEFPEVVDNRAEPQFRAEAERSTAGSTAFQRPEPQFRGTVIEPSKNQTRASTLRGSSRKLAVPSRRPGGPIQAYANRNGVPPRATECPYHIGQLAASCRCCRSERLGASV